MTGMKVWATIVGESEVRALFERAKRIAATATIQKWMLSGGEAIRQSIVREIVAKGLRDSGRLAESITVDFGSGSELIVYTDLVYAAIHEYGGTISAKNAPFLVFQGSQGLVRVPSVFIPATPYFRPGIEKGRIAAAKAVATAITAMIGGL